MNLLSDIYDAIIKNKDLNAFCINGTFYSYNDLALCITKIRSEIQKHTTDVYSIGLVTHDDLQTYASIFALWFEGKAYVPINPKFPQQRNQQIIDQAGIQYVLNSDTNFEKYNIKLIHTSFAFNSSEDVELPKVILEDQLAYIFFTSGTTGVPKGVPITLKNLSAFVDAFNNMDYPITNTDRCLQMFDLTFDLSVFSYLLPILNGACVYTIPPDAIKYSYIYELLEDQEISFALMVPSILHYLRPYFSEIHCPKLKYNLFCGEALPVDVVKEWSSCVPNALIANVYGPTECTIFCTNYTLNFDEIAHHNGVVAIGKPMKNTDILVVDENNNLVNIGNEGELCLSGKQLTSGYWNNEEKNRESFFWVESETKRVQFYRTGDLCKADESGNLQYLGRVDFQAKIQGYRVELSEIEYEAKKAFPSINLVAVAFVNQLGNYEIGLCLETEFCDTLSGINLLKDKLPQYMIPTKIKFLKEFPLNSNGKTDRKKIMGIFS